MEAQKMELMKRTDGWWITGVPDTDDCGPYDRKADAESDRRGMARFFRHADERDFFTVDRQADQKVVADAVSAAGKHPKKPGGSQSAAAPQPLTTKP